MSDARASSTRGNAQQVTYADAQQVMCAIPPKSMTKLHHCIGPYQSGSRETMDESDGQSTTSANDGQYGV